MRWFSLLVVLLTFAVGCDSGDNDRASASNESRSAVIAEPVYLIISQRETQPIPGSSDQLLLTIDDITRGQVMTNISDHRGTGVLAIRSMKEGDEASFVYHEIEYVLELTGLQNSLIGTDYALFEIRPEGSKSALERDNTNEKIEELINSLGELEGAVFVRNGREYSAEVAMEHLRSKWTMSNRIIATPEIFIDQIATRSSLTQEEYMIRFPNGKEVKLGDWLREQLD